MSKNTALPSTTGKNLEVLARHFHALGEVSRLKLIFAVGHREKNVTELIAATGLSQANVSKQLRILTDAALLIRRKKGVFVFYSTPDSTVLKLCKILNQGFRSAPYTSLSEF